MLLLGVTEPEDFCGKVLFMRDALALYTGCLRNELLGLKLGNVDFTTRLIYLKKTKSGEWQVIPISEETRRPWFGGGISETEYGWEPLGYFFTLLLLRGKK